MDSTAPSVCAEQPAAKGILATLQNRVGPQKFNAWFKRGAHIDVEGGRVRLAVPNPFVANWIETHFHDDIMAAAAEHVTAPCHLLVTVDPSLTGDVRKRQLDSQAEIVRRARAPRRGRAAGGGEWRGHGDGRAALRYSLSDFVVGKSNKLAYSAAVAMSGNGGAPFSLLFVHGSCGVGKTHLLQGICGACSRRGGRVRWRYVTGEQFTNEYVAALRGKKFAEFRQRYRNLDLLAIDDVHFLSAKRAIQDEFLHTFDAIDGRGSRIVLASDAHPKLVGDFNEQLISRFSSGMVVKIDLPDPRTRLEILRRLAGRMKLPVAEEVLEYIGMHIRGSVRELEGALIKLAAVSALGGAEDRARARGGKTGHAKAAAARQIDLQEATQVLAEHLARTDSAITLGDIEAASAAFFGITPADIHSTRRTRTVSVARMVAMFLARRHTQMSFPEIGRAMGKNHSSVVLAVQRMEKALAEKSELAWMTPMGRKAMRADKLLELLTEQFT
jgi:chromosomal replication initiator protein